MEADPDDKEDWITFNNNRSKFVKRVKQYFNQYRKEITGAAASEKEMEDLLASMINADMGPSEFRAVFDDFLSMAQANASLNARQLGYEPGANPAGEPPPNLEARGTGEDRYDHLTLDEARALLAARKRRALNE